MQSDNSHKSNAASPPRDFPFKAELIATSSRNNRQIFSAYYAIKPETSVELSERGTVIIELLKDQTLVLTFFAQDFISLRAMVCSYIRWLNAAIETVAELI